MGDAPQSAEPVRVLEQLPDGTIRQRSPITGTVVWTVPGRANRPFASPQPTARPLARDAFGQRVRLLQLPIPRDSAGEVPAAPRIPTPTRSATVADPAEHLPADRVGDTVADFRRFPNLFEILPFDYWHTNHGFQVPAAAAAWARDYMATPTGRAHVLAIARTRARASARRR